jgi:hypothetical protein
MRSDIIAGITRLDCIKSTRIARRLLLTVTKKGELRVSARYMKWQPTFISRIQVIESTMTILHNFERSESWPVAAKKVKNSPTLGIRIFVESGLEELEERLIIKTTVRFLDHLVCPFI